MNTPFEFDYRTTVPHLMLPIEHEQFCSWLDRLFGTQPGAFATLQPTPQLLARVTQLTGTTPSLVRSMFVTETYPDWLIGDLPDPHTTGGAYARAAAKSWVTRKTSRLCVECLRDRAVWLTTGKSVTTPYATNIMCYSAKHAPDAVNRTGQSDKKPVLRIRHEYQHQHDA